MTVQTNERWDCFYPRVFISFLTLVFLSSFNNGAISMLVSSQHWCYFNTGAILTLVLFQHWCYFNTSIISTLVLFQHWCYFNTGAILTLVLFQHWCFFWCSFNTAKLFKSTYTQLTGFFFLNQTWEASNQQIGNFMGTHNLIKNLWQTTKFHRAKSFSKEGGRQKGPLKRSKNPSTDKFNKKLFFYLKWHWEWSNNQAEDGG